MTLDFKLIQTEAGLSLESSTGLKFNVDFINDKASYWKKIPKGKNELLAKALGLSKGSKKILDATAGLLQDGFLMARWGCQVTACEKSKMLFKLLEDAYQRGSEDQKTIEVLNQIKLVHQDSIQYMQKIEKADRPQVIYLDPMFPESKKSALPKKEMQIFRQLEDTQTDIDLLFSLALKTASERVVVKRHLKGPAIAPKYNNQFLGKTIRYDVYLIR